MPYVKAKPVQKPCAYCRKPTVGQPHRKYCSDACRVASRYWRLKKEKVK